MANHAPLTSRRTTGQLLPDTENISTATPCASFGAVMARPWHHAPRLVVVEPLGIDAPSAGISTQRARGTPQPHVGSDAELLAEFKESAQ